MDYLPIFMNIRQQHCVIVGGGAVAARKADLFIKAGATVTVIAPQLKQEMQFHLSHGKIVWLMETFSEEVMASLSKPEVDDLRNRSARREFGRTCLWKG